MNKGKYLVLGVIIVVLMAGLWGSAGWLVSQGSDSSSLFVKEDKVNAPTESVDDESKGVIDDGEIEVVMGAKGYLTPVQGSDVESNIIAVSYAFFKDNLPKVVTNGLEYEVKKVEDSYYCFKIGDWFLFLNEDYNLLSVDRYCKSVDFTEEEKTILSAKYKGSEFKEKDGVFEWVITTE